jgi:hypothetical protein
MGQRYMKSTTSANDRQYTEAAGGTDTAHQLKPEQPRNARRQTRVSAKPVSASFEFMVARQAENSARVRGKKDTVY